MPKEIFKLTEEFIPLDKLLKLLGVAETGGMAHQMIVNGEVKVNGNAELQKRKKLRTGDSVSFEDYQISIE
ncbi:MAG: RNA-binding S4 domain-containing protein [Salibacteraceae bacterium]